MADAFRAESAAHDAARKPLTIVRLRRSSSAALVVYALFPGAASRRRSRCAGMRCSSCRPPGSPNRQDRPRRAAAFPRDRRLDHRRRRRAAHRALDGRPRRALHVGAAVARDQLARGRNDRRRRAARAPRRRAATAAAAVRRDPRVGGRERRAEARAERALSAAAAEAGSRPAHAFAARRHRLPRACRRSTSFRSCAGRCAGSSAIASATSTLVAREALGRVPNAVHIPVRFSPRPDMFSTTACIRRKRASGGLRRSSPARSRPRLSPTRASAAAATEHSRSIDHGQPA